MKNEFQPKGYVAVMMENGYLLGVNNYKQSPTWRDRMAAQDFEKEETGVVKKLLPLVDYFVDIGAHIGYYTCLAAHSGKKVLAFEPIKESYKTLLKNLEVNRFDEVSAHNLALGENEKKAIVYGEDAGSSIIKDSFPKETEQGTTVEVGVLDNYINVIPAGSPTMLKIDTEGGEYAIIQGGKKFITAIQPLFMFMEIVKNWGGGRNPNFEKTFEELEEMGYEKFLELEGEYFFVLSEANNGRIKEIIEEIKNAQSKGLADNKIQK
ncbi:MAG TPA: FkbM family methyltransferase [bacterium]|nr:FkbM family methyltransferase [bacterium]